MSECYQPQGKRLETGKRMASIKLTEKQIIALLWAIEITTNSYDGYGDDIADWQRVELRRLAAIKDKLENA